MYINNDYNNNNDNNEMTREQYQKTLRILGIILVTVLVLLVVLIVGKKLNIIDKTDRFKPYLTTVTIESNNVIDKFSAEVGNEIILNMEFSEELKEKPTVVINNTPIKVGIDGNKYFAKYHVEEQYYRDKEVEFKIENYRDKAKNIGERVTLTTDNSKVVIRAQNTIITPVEVESIKIETPKKVLNVNETVRIKTTIKPANATNKSVTWSSSNEEVAIVDSGIVRAVAEGTTDITATINGKTSTVQIIVKEKRIK